MSNLLLKSQHLIFLQPVAEKWFKDETHLFIKYNQEGHLLLVTPATNFEFKIAHKAGQHLLKNKNLNGDKSVAIHEILIDNELDETDRPLTFIEEEGIIKINL